MRPLHVLLKCFGPLLRLAFREGEPPDERRRKALILPALFVNLIAVIVILPSNMKYLVSFVASAFQLVCTVALFFYLFVTKRLDQTLADVVIVVLGVFYLMLLDFRTYGRMDYYAVLIVIMDLLLLTNSHKATVNFSRNIILVYIVVMTVEQAFDVGVYQSLPTMSSYALPAKCERDMDTTVGVLLLISRLFVFTFDFALTQHFAYSMRREQEQINAVVHVTQRVAKHMVNFDLSEAERLVMVNQPRLPPDLYLVLTGLLKNLQSYRPYLPQSCIPRECAADDNSSTGVDTSRSESGTLSTSTSQAREVTRGPELQRRYLTLIALNLRHFLDSASQASGGQLRDYYSVYLATILSCTRAEQGLCELVSGDRVTCTFNAAKPVTQHNVRATRCAMHIASHLPFLDDPMFSTVLPSIGVATGDATCGAMGCAELVRYTILGNVSSWVYKVEQAASDRNTCLLVESNVKLHVEHMYHLRLVCMEQSQHHKKNILLWHPTGEKAADTEEEWMYQLGSLSDIWQTHNAVILLLLEGRAAEALVLADELSLDLSVPENHHLYRQCVAGVTDPWKMRTVMPEGQDMTTSSLSL